MKIIYTKHDLFFFLSRQFSSKSEHTVDQFFELLYVCMCWVGNWIFFFYLILFILNLSNLEIW